MTATRALRDPASPGRLRPARQDARRDRARLRVVPDAATLRRDRLARLFTALAALGVCFGLFGVVGVHVMLAQGQGDVQRLQDQLTQEQARQQRLRLQVAELEAPSRIVADARQKLGMVSPATVVSLAPASLADPPPTTIAPALPTSVTTLPPTTVPATARR